MSASVEATKADRGTAPIAFGTSGWRGVAGVDFTAERVAAAVAAVARWLAEECPGGEVIVAHDTRRGGPEFAELACRALRAEGAAVVCPPGPVPTPVVTRALLSRGAAGAVVFTASHNPPEYRGMKVFGASGGSLPRDATRRIESLARAGVGEPRAASGGGPVEDVDLVADYIAALLGEIDRAPLAEGHLAVCYDAMHGAGSGVLDRALTECGAEVTVLRGECDPEFGGAPPDPRPRRLGELVRRVAGMDAPCLGLATDGDADRFVVVTALGRVLSETEAVALLIDHLAASGRLAGGVAISLATGSLVERVAAGHGLRSERCPIGFSHLSARLHSGAAQAAGEESGGFALGRFSRDKDGILAGCLLAEMAAAGPGLDERLAELTKRHGPSSCGRSSLPRDPDTEHALARLFEEPPEEVDGCAVISARREDGLHLALPDGFLMLRASGTEPRLRVYAEARDPVALERRLAAGRALLAP